MLTLLRFHHSRWSLRLSHLWSILPPCILRALWVSAEFPFQWRRFFAWKQHWWQWRLILKKVFGSLWSVKRAQDVWRKHKRDEAVTFFLTWFSIAFSSKIALFVNGASFWRSLLASAKVVATLSCKFSWSSKITKFDMFQLFFLRFSLVIRRFVHLTTVLSRVGIVLIGNISFIDRRSAWKLSI